MSRYLIERDFPDGLVITQDAAGANLCQMVIDNNAEDGVTWVHSYVTPDRKRTFCIYDGPTPEAFRRTAVRNKMAATKKKVNANNATVGVTWVKSYANAACRITFPGS
jgi:Protein of unknown function (DUF4242)